VRLGRTNLAEIVALNPADPTSSSLLRRALAREPDAWERLVSLYSPLVHYWCRQAGIAQHEIADVTQEVFAAVASSLGQFRPEQPGTTFRAWMRGITRHKLLHHARDRGEPAVGGTDAQIQLQQVPAPADEVELSESPAEVSGLYQRALRLVQHQVEDRTWTAFWKATVESRPTSDVAAELGISPNAVRLAKSHVLRRLREEMGELIA
jgi:RNA polymerase sigma-70 factor, ECF subfamily